MDAGGSLYDLEMFSHSVCHRVAIFVWAAQIEKRIRGRIMIIIIIQNNKYTDKSAFSKLV